MNLVQKLIDLDASSPKRICVIGDAMTDVYVHGHFGTCQEECYKFIEERRVECPGGSGNAYACLMNWEGFAMLCTQSTALHNNGNIPIKTRFLVNGKFVFRYDKDRRPIEKEMEYQRIKVIEELQNWEPHAILLSDYDKGFLTPSFIQEVIAFADEIGIPCVADAKRHPSLYKGAIIKGNSNYDDRYECDFSDEPRVCTFGNRPPSIFGLNEDYKEWAEGTYYEEVLCISHVGAGDCFAAHLTLALAHGFSLEDSTSIAHSSGRVYVQHEHNRAPYPHEIAKDFDSCRGKVITSSTLATLRQSIPGRIVFTNGVFRVPHAGHAWLLSWAKKQGEVLVVGVNDDASASRCKPGEYVMPLEDRLEILCGMEAVDWVIVFGEDTPVETIDKLRPSCIVKGHEYASSRIPGTAMVNEILFATPGPFVDHSSTRVIATIVERSRSTNHHDQEG